MLKKWTAWARSIRRDALMLWFARRHPATPWTARLLCVLTVAYALSPIDLIPDFIPVLGVLDDLLLIPLLIWITVRLMPASVVLDCRMQADDWLVRRQAKPVSIAGGVIVVLLWLALAWAAFAWWLSRR